jgi:hypothetical protein
MSKRKEIEDLLGEEFFLPADDKAFIAFDALKYKELYNALKQDVTGTVLKRWEETAEKNLPIIAIVFGPPQSGINWSGLSIACAIKDYYDKMNKSSIIHLCFDDYEVNECLKKAKIGDIIFQSERPISHGPGSRISADAIANMCKVFQGYGINYIASTNHEIHLSGLSIKFESLGFTESKVRLLVRGGRNNTLLGYCIIESNVPTDLWDEYNRQKMEHIDELLSTGGMHCYNQQRMGERLREDSKKLMEYIEANDIPISLDNYTKLKQDLRPLIEMVEIKFVSEQYLRDLISYVVILYRMNQTQKKIM